MNPNEKSPCKNEGYTERERDIHIYIYVCMYVRMYRMRERELQNHGNISYDWKFIVGKSLH